MQANEILDKYDKSVLRLVQRIEESQDTNPAVIDIFKGLQQEPEGSSKCYDTLRYRLRGLMDAGFLELDTVSDRSHTIVRLTADGRRVLESFEENNLKSQAGRGEKPAPEGACFS
jgi:hypothetical protein